jgi:hypothetical protein
MKKLRFLLALTNDDNDYQIEQASAAEAAARAKGIDLEIVYAGNDGIKQSQQLLSCIQSTAKQRTDAIIFEPAGSTNHPQVVRAAAAAGIGVVLLNREADYIGEIRNQFHVPAFAITSDHEEIGRIQGQQLSSLVPDGGIVLYIHGPGESSAAKQRYHGLLQTKAEGLTLRVLKGCVPGSGFPPRTRYSFRRYARKMIRWPWERAKRLTNAAEIRKAGRKFPFSGATGCRRPDRSGFGAVCSPPQFTFLLMRIWQSR